MRVCCVLLFALLFFNKAGAQWKKVYIPSANDLYDVQIVNHMVYAAGNSSAFLKSSDTGKSWNSLILANPNNIRAICFLDTINGFIIGENAKIQRTRNGGKTWTQKYIRTAAYGYDMAFLNEKGIAVGKDMLAISTIDTGNTWRVDTTFSKFKKLNSVCIMPDGNCWAVGDSGYILNKNINQRKWKVTKYPTIVDLNHVSAIGNHTLIITGGMPDSAIVGKYYNILMMSTDTGKSWIQNTIGEMKIINSAYFETKDTGFLAGSSGIVSKCSNGIYNRGIQLTGSASSLNEIEFSNGIGIIVGDGGAILRTTNAGGKVLALDNDLSKENDFSLFPNPSNGSFKIYSNEPNFKVSIVNMEGKLVYLNNFNTNEAFIQLDISGIYTVILQSVNSPVNNQRIQVQIHK